MWCGDVGMWRIWCHQAAYGSTHSRRFVLQSREGRNWVCVIYESGALHRHGWHSYMWHDNDERPSEVERRLLTGGLYEFPGVRSTEHDLTDLRPGVLIRPGLLHACQYLKEPRTVARLQKSTATRTRRSGDGGQTYLRWHGQRRPRATILFERIVQRRYYADAELCCRDSVSDARIIVHYKAASLTRLVQ